MAERIDLGNDQWVIFRGTDTMTNRQRRPYMDLLFKMRKKTWRPDDDAESGWKWGVATSYMLVSDWSRSEPVPVEYDLFALACEELPVEFADQMMLAASQFLMGEADPTTPGTTKKRTPAKKRAVKKT